ncbi:MAG: PDZ domain-containing protein [Nitrospirae bacterium]|nr:PDZ domain-containing protein [Nitrospirota bacterium]
MLQFSVKKLRLINYVLLLLILISTLYAARALVTFYSYGNKDISAGVEGNAPAETSNIIRDITGYSPIVAKNPFGPPMRFYIIAPPEAEKAQAETAETSLASLRLIGTVTGPENLSYAIIIDTSGPSANKAEVFALGEAVSNYGILTEVLSESVKIISNGITQTLEMIQTAVLPDNNAYNYQPETLSASKEPFVKKVGKRKFQVDRKQVQSSMENPEKILTDARLLPNFVNGKQDGYSISEVKPGGLYENLGLKNGDILLRVNNLEISNPEVAIQAMSAIRGTNNVNLDIIRNNQKMSLTYELK